MISILLLTSCVPLTKLSGPKRITGNLAYINNPHATPEEFAQIASANNQFAFSLYQQLSKAEGNLVFSPYSIHQALTMTYAGARSETEAQMATVLGLKDLNDPHRLINALNRKLIDIPEHLKEYYQPVEINLANALWLQNDFKLKQDFIDLLSSNYDAGLYLLDFSKTEKAVSIINNWVSTQTNNKIKDLLSPSNVNGTTRLVLTNAIYFNGAWLDKFRPEFTGNAPFFSLDGTHDDVDMMSGTFFAKALVNDELSAVVLPYDGRTYAMVLLMPKDFSVYQQGFNADSFEKLLADLQETYSEVNLEMPKFKIETRESLAEQLKTLGMPNAFSNADFSGMTGGRDLLIDDVIHQAMIDVTENGTEAAAATAVVMVESAPPSADYKLDITFNRPFIYAIYNTETNAIVFMGHFVAP
jgi:serpin B